MQLVAGEAAVAVFCDRRFYFRHAVVVAQEHPARDTRALLGGGRVWLERRSPLLLPFGLPSQGNPPSRLSGGRSGIKALVTQYPQEATVTGVYLIGNTSEVADIVIGGTAVDMVYGHTGRNRSSGSHPDGMGSKDLFLMTESICEK